MHRKFIVTFFYTVERFGYIKKYCISLRYHFKEQIENETKMKKIRTYLIG